MSDNTYDLHERWVTWEVFYLGAPKKERFFERDFSGSAPQGVGLERSVTAKFSAEWKRVRALMSLLGLLDIVVFNDWSLFSIPRKF